MVDLNRLENQLTKYNPGGFPKTPSINAVPSPTPEGSTLGAVFAQEHTIGNIINKFGQEMPAGEAQPDFNPIKYIPPQLYNYADRYAALVNEDQVQWMSDQINKELRDKAIIAGNPWRAFGSNILVNAVDLPTYLLPGGVIYSNATRGLNIARSALTVAGANAFSTLITESVLHETQYARRVDESIMNVFGSAFVGATVGAAAGALMPRNLATHAAKEAAETMTNGHPTSRLIEFTPEGGIKVTENVPIIPTKPVGGKEIAPLGIPETIGGVPAINNPAPTGVEIFRGEREGPITYQILKEASSIANINETVLQAVKFNPWMRLKLSPFGIARATADNLFESMIGTLSTDIDLVAAPRALESMIKTLNVEFATLNLDFQRIYFKQRGLGDGGVMSKTSAYYKALVNQEPLPGLNVDDFSLRVYRAIRDNILDPDPHVMEAKEFARWKIIDRLKKEAIEVDLLGKDVHVSTADGYLTRMYNTPAITERMADFDATSMRYVTAVNEMMKAILPKVATYTKAIQRADRLLAANIKLRDKISILEKELANATIPKQQADITKQINDLKTIINNQPDDVLNQAKELFIRSIEGLKTQRIGGQLATHPLHSDGVTWRKVRTDAELRADATQLRQKILSLGDERIANPVFRGVVEGNAKPTKQRAYLIPDAWIEEFVIKDMSTILAYYSKSMTTAIATARWARNQGFVDVGSARSAIKVALRDEWEEAMKGVTGKEAVKLTDQLAKDISDIDSSIDIMLGIFGAPASSDDAFAKIAKNFLLYNQARLMGSMTLSAFPDAGKVVMRYGMYELIHSGILPLLKNKQLKAMSSEYLRVIGFAINTENGLRIKSYADTADLSVATNQWGKITNEILQGYGNVVLFNQQNDMFQRIAGTLAVHFHLSRIASYVEKGKDSVSKIDRRWMARAGLSPSDFPYYYEQWKKHGGTYDSSYFSNVHKWDVDTPFKAAAYQKFNEAIRKEVHNTIVEPTLQDKPLFTQYTLGKVITQFKSFQFAATNKIFMSAIQNRDDQNMISGLMTMLALGALGYTATSLARGDEPNLDFKNISKEAIDRSGILGMFSEFYNMANKIGVVPGQGVSRYKTRGVIGAVFGPSVGALEDIASFLSKVAQANGGNPLTTKDVDALLRLMPYQNLFYAHQLTRAVARKAAVAVGIQEAPETKRSR